MKYKDLAKYLAFHGWQIERQGGSHEIWSNGERKIPVPRHKEINEITAKKIMAAVERKKGH